MMTTRANMLAALLLSSALAGPPTGAATMYSTRHSYMGPGTFWGPGSVEESQLFDLVIHNVGLSSRFSGVTPFQNNGADAPNICGERESGRPPSGLLSDGTTRLNEAFDACAFELGGQRVLVGAVDGGPHAGRQSLTILSDGTMIVALDFAFDFGEAGGVTHVPLYGTTGEVSVPASLQTQAGLGGGVDRAGKQAAGTKLRGRLGDFDGDGMLDGALVFAGTLPLDSGFMPGAPYAFLRYFVTDMPYGGKTLGKLPRAGGDAPRESMRVEPPTAAARPHDATGTEGGQQP